MTTQSQELLTALKMLRQREEELKQLNGELTVTNTGIIALYAELEANAQRLKQSEQRLLERNDELKGFAYTVAHDLKAPLRGIAGYAHELERKHTTGLSERALFCLSQILTATHNLDRLIEDLLRFARMDAAVPSFVEVNLGSLVAAILQEHSHALTEQHVEVTVDIPFMTLRTWEAGLLQVMGNLIDNAIKYSRKAHPPRIGIRAEELSKSWRLIVSDNGIGFDMKYYDRLFKLFSRLVGTEEFEGTGAGLAIAKKVLDKLCGSMRAESKPGQGATFYVELPKLPSPPEVQSELKPADEKKVVPS